MKTSNHISRFFQVTISFLVLFVLFVLVSFKDNGKLAAINDKVQSAQETKGKIEAVWHVKGIYPDGRLLNIIAVDAYGESYKVKALQRGDQRTLMSIKALVNDKIISVKLLVNEGKQTPLVAIAKDSSVYQIKAVAPNGERLSVRGVLRSGNIIHIKVIGKNGEFYGLKAISPEGQLHDIKGVKTKKEDLEYTLFGANVYAHVKAIPQAAAADDNFLWHIVGVHPEGYFLEVKALDDKGNTFDVNAILDSDQRSLINIKAFKSDTEILPVKIVSSKDNYKTVAAIGEKGSIYKLVAIDKNGDQLEVKGVREFENIIDIKVINKKGEYYGVKAISQAGQMNDVKGMKMLNEPIEMKIDTVAIYAHVKAFQQVY
ncbi:hypothetical protein JBL43_09420 [Aureibaculum sp. A20]|uniref:DUF7486 domain-containing protein n=1 Tax=Aureibaculum flavum TaxID=2795986 RepID=A0ABS0WR51_9FLAO|nr:hypothetical protein [Aureibaculum flavum]MBJ2174455.1 hypothetical protein [Aureibaculum flavum]